MTVLSIFAISLSLIAILIVRRKARKGTTVLLLALLLIHVAASTTYYFYSLTDGSDAYLYYYDPFRMARREFAFGTTFVVKLVSTFRSQIGGTYFDYFMIFQAIGFLGILFLWSVMEQIHMELGVPRSKLSYLIFFLPGLHFWSSAIGKDAPLFLAVCMAAWSALRIPRRLLFFILAVGIMVLFRPHIALLAIAALAIATLFDRRSKFPVKAVLTVTALIGLVYVAATVQSTIRLDVSDPESISEFFAARQEVAQQAEGTTAVYDATFFGKLLSLLFRPLFFDADGILAMIASIENLFFVFLFGFMMLYIKQTAMLVRRVYFLRFSFIYTMLVMTALTLVYFNVGLGLRQKWMFMPTLFALFIALWALPRRKPAAGRRRQYFTAVPPAKPDTGIANASTAASSNLGP